MKHEGELVVAAIGPLTNLALACKLDIDFPERVKALYVMGRAGEFALRRSGGAGSGEA